MAQSNSQIMFSSLAGSCILERRQPFVQTPLAVLAVVHGTQPVNVLPDTAVGRPSFPLQHVRDELAGWNENLTAYFQPLWVFQIRSDVGPR